VRAHFLFGGLSENHCMLSSLWQIFQLYQQNVDYSATQLNSTLLWHTCSWTAKQLDC